MPKSVSAKFDFGHFWSLEQASGCVWLARYDFLLVFYSDVSSGWNCCQVKVSRTISPNKMKKNVENSVFIELFLLWLKMKCYRLQGEFWLHQSQLARSAVDWPEVCSQENSSCTGNTAVWLVGCSLFSCWTFDIYVYALSFLYCLQCFDTVGSVAGRASGL